MKIFQLKNKKSVDFSSLEVEMGCIKLKYCSEKEVPGVNLVLKKGVSGKNKGEGKSCAGAYRFGFQGQEKDDEIKGTGNSINYKYRMHDPRIGRFFAVDPIASKFPHNSPYAFSENRVIDGLEWEGLEVVLIGKQSSAGAGASYTAEMGIAFDMKGNIYAYGSTALGLESNLSVAQQVSVTIFPNMPHVEYASGWGFDGGVSGSTPGAGWTGSINASYSNSGDGYWGINFTAGWGASKLPADVSGYGTYTGLEPLVSNEENLQLLKDGKSTIDDYNASLKQERKGLLDQEELSENDQERLETLSSDIESFDKISNQFGETIDKMEGELNEEKND